MYPIQIPVALGSSTVASGSAVSAANRRCLGLEAAAERKRIPNPRKTVKYLCLIPVALGKTNVASGSAVSTPSRLCLGLGRATRIRALRQPLGQWKCWKIKNRFLKTLKIERIFFGG